MEFLQLASPLDFEPLWNSLDWNMMVLLRLDFKQMKTFCFKQVEGQEHENLYVYSA